MRDRISPYPPLKDYALISDCHCAALISRAGSVDWCCMPRIDGDSNFGRLLDWNRGGCWSISPADKRYETERHYEPGSLVLMSEFKTPQGTAKLIDFMAMSDAGLSDSSTRSHSDLHVRIVEGVSGEVDLNVLLAPRFDYGAVLPCIHRHADNLHVAWGSNQGLIIYSSISMSAVEDGRLTGSVRIAAGERAHFSIRSVEPERLSSPDLTPPETPEYLDQMLDETLSWWQRWSKPDEHRRNDDGQTMQSALMLKGLTVEQTGAVAAAATTSLPEWVGGSRTWDYRYSWIRDSVFTARALHELGFMREADRFADFIERSAAGSAKQLQVVFGVDGKRRLTEAELPWLEGYRRSAPVRIGNGASQQAQHDAYGELLELAWIRHCHGSRFDERRWSFLKSLVNIAAERWPDPDYGIWEVRTEPLHFVFSKAMCWRALDRGIEIARHYRFEAPLDHWESVRAEIKAAIVESGYDSSRGIFRQAYASDYLDSSLLLLPWFGFLAYDDPRMIRTVDAIKDGLDRDGLLLRYNSPDGLPGPEGAFLPSTFWLVDCLANQGRIDEALVYYRRALACANDVGLFSEEFDARQAEMLGNLPQGLTHVSQIIAYLALTKTGNAPGRA